MYYIGIDLGTSSVKELLMDSEGKIKKIVSKEYPLSVTNGNWSEQNPGDWWIQSKAALKELVSEIDGDEVAGISFGGQMHGLVILDENDEVIRPAILWNDGRTTVETDFLNNEVGRDKLTEYTGNIAFTGFTAPKILWVRNNEPENFKKIRKIMLPKDYVAYMLTGVHSCDYSDASGMLLLDVKNKCWSKEMMEICGVSEDMMPSLFESYEVTGTIRPEIADELGISRQCRIIAGAGDNAAAAVGTGTVGPNMCNISLGTSGTIFITSDSFGVDKFNALHSFAHADGGFHLMGCMLSAASCNNWWMKDIMKTDDFAGEQKDIDVLGENDVYFLPYLMGERSPHNDPYARGTFTGLTLATTRAQILQAIFEGVSFAIRDCYEVAKSLGITIESSKVCGGGAKSDLWMKILANVLGIRIDHIESEEGPSLGGAILAAVGCGEFASVSEACEKIVKITDSIVPDPELVEKYNDRYSKFRTIYPALKDVFRNL
ncbi:MAG: xylulokinase [Lachnospiraceae bacterium]